MWYELPIYSSLPVEGFRNHKKNPAASRVLDVYRQTGLTKLLVQPLVAPEIRDEFQGRSEQLPQKFYNSLSSYLLVPAECSQQMKQAGEQVVDGDEQSDGGQDVVGLAAVHDLAGLIQDQT